MNSLYATPMQAFIEFIKVIACALLIAFVIRVFIIQPYYIPSGSMLDTLKVGDRLFVTRFSYGIHLPFMLNELIATGEPKRGDIIVFPFPKDKSVDFIKRVVGIAGDTIEVKNKQLFRNGEAVSEKYISHADPLILNSVRDNMPALTVPEGKLFVMGDNRDYSEDSRYWGFVDKKNLRGKALIVFWSSEDLFNVKWDRIGTRLDRS